MKSKLLFIAVVSLSLLLTGVTPTFAAKGAKGSKTKAATSQLSTTGKHHKHGHHKKHQKLTKGEKKAIKHAVKKSQKKHATAKV